MDISKTYGDVKAVDSVNLELYPGECLALLGRNGAGKTSICEMLIGITMPDAGEISIMGEKFHAKSANRRKILEHVGILSQETRLYQKFTVRETISLFASFYRNPVSIDEVIEQLAIEDKQHKKLEQLSGGEKQRAYLAVTLVADPKIIFLDEPTTGLDPMSRKNVWEIVEDLKRKGKSIFLTTHYMEEADRLADKVVILEKGKIIDQGTTKDLIHKHCEQDVVTVTLKNNLSLEELSELQGICLKLVSSSNKLRGVNMEIDGKSKQEVTQIKEGVYEIRSSETPLTIKEVFLFFDRISNSVMGMDFRKSTLEDVFFKLTGKKLP